MQHRIQGFKKLAALLEHRVNQAALLLEAAIATRPNIGATIGDILHQQQGEQTARMAMLIITNAFVFQSSLAGKPEMEQVSSLAQLTIESDTPIKYSDCPERLELLSMRSITGTSLMLPANSCKRSQLTTSWSAEFCLFSVVQHTNWSAKVLPKSMN